MNQSEQHSVDYRISLAANQIPLGELTIPTKVSKQRFLELVAMKLRGKPREWKDNDHVWTRYTLVTEILWYSARPVSFTFSDDVLVLVDFSTAEEPNQNWDYSVEVQRYSDIKKTVVQSLGTETRSHETDSRNMETVWDFGKQLVFVSCDAKTGGSSIGLRTNLKSE
jgi:hypothetical protein